ncbi:MAG: transglutaminase-like domain-containing protein [Pseudomonadota bacterium]
MHAVAPCSNPCTDSLRETALLDFSHPRLQLCARRLAGPGLSARDRVLAIHSFVRLIPLRMGAPPATPVCASRVLRGERGDANSKGVLFVALCRAAGVPARLRIFRLRSDPLHALRGGHDGAVLHPVGQVWLEGRWLSTDAYLLDPLLFALARRRQTQERRDGWGPRPDAPAIWDGHDDCLQLFSPADVLHGPASVHDPAPIAPRTGGPARVWLLARMQALLRTHAHLDRRLRRLREAPPPAGRRASPG